MATFSDGGLPTHTHHSKISDFLSHSSNTGDMRHYLQTLLDTKEKQLQQAGALGQRVLAQQVELEERVRQLQEIDADKGEDVEIDADMRERYRQLAESVSTWEAENVQLSSAFGSKRLANGGAPSPQFENLEMSREEPERPKPTAGTSAAQSSRRAKNAAHRADDVEFAFEIGSGLLTEVRRLQSLLGERDKAIQDMKEEKDDLERSVESLRNALKTQEQHTDKYKEENWNLEVTLQELRAHLADSQASVQRLEGEHKRLTKLLNQSREATDQHKTDAERVKIAFDELKAKHETDVAQARRQVASLQRDKSDLQQNVDNLKTEMARQGRRLPRFGSPLTPDGRERSDLLTPQDAQDNDVFSAASTNRKRQDSSTMFSMDGEYDSSPEPSPSKPFLAPNHPSNEMEALQQRLAHAQRQINTLKSTLQREKELKIEYRRRLDQSPAVGGGLGAEEDVSDGEQDGQNQTSTPVTGQRKRKTTPFRVGRGRGSVRGRGRGGLTLQQRLEKAARSPASEYDEDLDEDFGGAVTSTPPPPVPPLPLRFTNGDAEADEEPEPGPDRDRELQMMMEYEDERWKRDSLASNRTSITSIDGMDPAFANILRRSSSSGSLPYNRSPLRQAVARAIPRRRGGAAYQEARPPSLVGQPEALAAELGLGMGMGASTSMTTVTEHAPELELEPEPEPEPETVVETAEFGCQTEPEVSLLPPPPPPPPPIEITPPSPETSEMGIQVDPPEPEPVLEPAVVTAREPEIEVAPEPVLPKVEMCETSMQTDPEPEPEPEPVPAPEPEPVVVVVERSEMGVQHEPVEAPVVHADMGIATDPEPVPIVIPRPVLVQAEVQTSPAQTLEADTQTPPPPVAPEVIKADADTQTIPEFVPLKIDTDVQTAELPPTLILSPTSGRRDTITQADWSRDHGGDNTLRGRPVMLVDEEDDEDDAATETGADTDTDAEFYDARQSVALTTPTYSMDEYHSIQTLTDNDMSGDEDEDDGESIKASRMSSPQGVDSRASSAFGRPESVYVPLPVVTYDSKSVDAVLVEEPLPEPPKPELKEMSIQTDAWNPTPPPPPPPQLQPQPQPLPAYGAFRVGSQSQQFQYVGSTSSTPSSPLPVLSVPSSPAAATQIIPRPRTSQSDSRKSIESTLSGALDDHTSRSRLSSSVNGPVDKTRPPMMMLPPPPRLPPPPSTMPPPQFIPERRVPTSSTSSYDIPPGRPSSPPPPELIQRATTPTFGLSLRPPFSPRQHGSSMPPTQQGLRQPPSTNSFRSAANAAAYAQVIPPSMVSFAGRDKARELSSTSLQSDHSLGSGRSSMSSDRHFLNRSQGPSTNAHATTPGRAADLSARSTGSTDPTVIHAITQTMIGEFLYKYTRRAIGKGYGEKRHKRFFWVHPYTKTLYWSSADPGSSNVIESSAKSAYIESVRSVLDPNPMPPGLYQYSVVVSTPQREMKITAPTKERHDIWLNALKYLLTRPNGMTISSPANMANRTAMPAAPLSPLSVHSDLPDDDNQPAQGGLLSSPQSFRSGHSGQTSGESWNVTPRGQRSQSQLSVGGSIGKRSGTPAAEYLRWGRDGPYSPTKSFEHVPGGQEEEDLDFELHDDSMSDEGFQGLENVRACCDGKHTVGGHDHHHHHHHHHQHNHSLPPNAHPPRELSRTRDQTHLDAPLVEPPRPASPAWSFRSRAGSATSHDGGLFSGKLRFGTRRPTKTVHPVGSHDS